MSNHLKVAMIDLILSLHRKGSDLLICDRSTFRGVNFIFQRE